ncbi:hypothetical protein AB1E19_011353 [Capra hircus]
MYNSWTWELRSHVQRLQDQLINQIQNGKIQTLETYTLEAPVAEIYEAIKQKLEKYFNEDPDSEVLVQWKGNFENKLITLKEALILDVQRKAEELIHFKKNQENLDNKKSGYEKKLLEKSRNLVLFLNSIKLSEEELHEKFNPFWEKWVYDVSSRLPPAVEPRIEMDSENILLEYFKKEKDIRSILENYSGEKFEINYDKHVKMNRKSWRVSSMTIDSLDIYSINMTTDNIISKVNETVNKISQQKHDYNPTYFYEILKIIEEEVISPSQKRYTFTRKYEIDLSLCLFQRASVKFKEMHKAFKRANDPVIYLQSKKDDFFMSFKISCQGATSITTFVDFLWKNLTPAVSSTIRKNMALKIAGDIRTTCRAFSENRANLEKHILISLAEEENFDNYWQYFHNPKSFFENYIENHVKRYFSDTGSEKIKTFLQISLDDIKNAILSAVRASTARAKDKSSTASGWLDLFCDQLGSSLIFPRKDLISIEHQEIKDTEFLKEAMSKALDPEIKKAANEAGSDTHAQTRPPRSYVRRVGPLSSASRPRLWVASCGLTGAGSSREHAAVVRRRGLPRPRIPPPRPWSRVPHSPVAELAYGIVRHERIEASWARVHELTGYAEKLIDYGKLGDTNERAMRMADFWLTEKDLIPELFQVLAPRYQGQNGGYTRMLQIPNRNQQDRAKMAVIEYKGNCLPPLPLPRRDSNLTLLNQLLQGLRQDQEASTRSSHPAQTPEV